MPLVGLLTSVGLLTLMGLLTGPGLQFVALVDAVDQLGVGRDPADPDRGRTDRLSLHCSWRRLRNCRAREGGGGVSGGQ